MAGWRLELLVTFQLVGDVTNLWGGGWSLWRGYHEIDTTEFLKKVVPNLPASGLKKKTKNKNRLSHGGRGEFSPSL